MSEPIRIGVVGAGAISQRGILPHLTQDDVTNRVRVGAICDPVAGRAEAAARKWNVPHAFTRYEDLLAAGEIDAVTIASPIGLHYEQGKMALESGKHIHFNKTMTTTVREANELIALAEQKSLRIVASPGEVLRPQLQETRRLIESGAIGTPCWAICGASSGRYHEDDEAEFRQGGDVLSTVDPSWYYRKPGGGPLYDMTVYALHALTTVLGSARRVTAMSGLRIPAREHSGKQMICEADDNTLMLLDFGNSLFAVVYGMAAGWATKGFYPRFFGTGGEIAGDKKNGQPFDYPKREIAALCTGWDGEQWVLPHVTESHRDLPEQHVFEDIMQLVDWVRDGIASPVNAAHARHVVDIIESAYRSAETGTAQKLETTLA